MQIAVVGTGGLGGAYGTLFARAGHDVSFIARGDNLVAMRANGLTFKSPTLGDGTLPVRATDDPREIGPVDLVLFCVKTYDLDDAARLMRPLVGPRTMVLPIQNGVDTAVRLALYVPPQQVLGGIAYLSARVEAPGVILHAEGNRLFFGELAGGSSPRVERLLAAAEQTALVPSLRTSIREDLWIKFVGICSASLTALTRLPVGAILATEEGRELYLGIMQEVAAVGRSCGVKLTDEAIAQRFESVCRAPNMRASQYWDLEAGRRLELESLNGAAVRLGRERKVPTPLNFAVYAALKPFVDGRPALPS